MEVIRNECISKLKVVQILQKAYTEGRIQAKDGLVSVLDDINTADVQPVSVIKELQEQIASVKRSVKSENSDYLTGYIAALSAVEGMIDDIQPVKRGYWKEEEPRVLKCSVCGEYAPMNYLGQNCIDSKYCPWCGARMDAELNEPWQSD